MSEAKAPLGGAHYDGLVTIDEVGPLGQVTLRGDFGAQPFRDAVTDTVGAEFPAPRFATWTSDRAALWMSPDELLLLLPYAQVAGTVRRLTDRLSGEHALVADVSDARAQFRLSGDAVREVLAKLSPADLSSGALPVGEVRRTKLGQVAAGLWVRSDSEVQVFCFRSVAGYAFEALKTAAEGGRVGVFSA